MRFSTVTLMLVLAAAVAAHAESQDDEARAQFEQGIALFEDGKHEQAAIAFERAFELKPSYKILYNLGQVHNELGHYAAALKAYSRYLAEGGDEVEDQRVATVKEEIARLNNLVGILIIETGARGAVVFVDDERQGETPLRSPVFVDLGRHTVVVKRGTEELHREAVKVAGSERVTIRLAAEYDDPPEPEEPGVAPGRAVGPQPEVAAEAGPERVWTWVAFGVGGAAAIAAGITGGLALSRKSTLEDRCPDQQCPSSEWETLDSGTNLAHATTALIVVAGVGLAAGVVLYFVEPGRGAEEPAVAVAPTMVPGGAGLAAGGRF